MIILGAGLSGLICGALYANATICERNQRETVTHRAVLRFRDEKVSRAIGIPFRRVTVRKAVWSQGSFVLPNPKLANLYSLKARQTVAENSIWNLAPEDRFIAPDNLQEQLADICEGRVRWGFSVTDLPAKDYHPIISTIPLPSICKILGIEHPAVEFKFYPITVTRYRLPSCDVHQTIYFPDLMMKAYRATITGDILTIESVDNGSAAAAGVEQDDMVFGAFGLQHLFGNGAELIQSNHVQQYGKIVPVPDLIRKMMLHMLTQTYGIYSLGRYATWRNILLDDVLDDIGAIRRMMLQPKYDTHLELTKGTIRI